MTVAELSEKMSHAEYIEWMAFLTVEAREREIEMKRATQRRSRHAR